MLVSNKVTIKKSDKYYTEILQWCKAELILPNPEYEKKQRMGFWIGKTPKNLYLYEENQGELILPFGCAKKMCEYYLKSDIYTDFANNEQINITGDVKLYDYQQTALDAMLKAKNGVLVSPAGSGKTQIGITLIKSLGLKTLWLTNKADLLKQSRDRFKQYLDCSIGTITAGKVSIGDVTFATVQTLSKMDLTQYAYEWDLVIVDECHHLAGSPTQITMFYKVLSNLKARNKYGLSATLHRSDGLVRAVTATLGDVIYEVPRAAVAEKTVNPVVQPIWLYTAESFEYLGTDGTLNYSKLINYLCDDASRTAQIVARVVDNAECSQLVLSDRISHLKAILEALRDKGLGDITVMIDGSMVSKKGKVEREQAIDDMRTGRKKILLATFSLAKEGLDVTILSRLHITTPVKDKAVVIQSVGRISRAHNGKPQPVVFDYIDSNIGYCVGAYKKRCTSYRKIQCEILK